MALPVEIVTRTVTYGPETDFQGNSVTGTLTFTPSEDIMWVASGQGLHVKPISVNLNSSGSGSIDLICTDQTGFRNANGQNITNWYYTVVADLVGVPGSTRKFLVPSGAGSLDLDTMIPITTGSTTISVPVLVDSVAGRTGAVTLTKNDVGLSNADNTADASKPISAATAAALADEATARSRNAADNVYYVATTGNDSNTGRSLGLPFLTIGAAFTALGTNPGTINVAAGTYAFSTSLLRSTGQTIKGAGKYATTLSYTGTGTAIGTLVTGVRIYGCCLSDFTLLSTTGTVGVDLDSVSLSDHYSVNVTGFSDAAYRIRSAVSGGSVYNIFVACLAFGKGIATASIGFDVQPSGSNTNNWFGCAARNCGIGLSILDSNQNTWTAGAFEVDGIGVKIDASAPSASNNNAVVNSRFESNTQNWNIASVDVRGAAIINPAEFTAAGLSTNLGTRSQITASSSANLLSSAVTSTATGNWRYERSSSGLTENPAMVFADTVTASGTPVTLQVETERSPGYGLRVKRGGTNYFDIDASGNVRQPAGSYFEMTERADPSAPAANIARLYVRDNGSGKTQLVIRFPTGAIQVISTEP